MDKETLALLRREGVTFVGKGKKIKNGIQTDEDAIIIGVVEKKPKSELTKSQLIPSIIESQKTDVVQTGRIKKRGYEEDRRTSRTRPIQPGTSVEYDMGYTDWKGQIIVGRTDDDEPSSDGGILVQSALMTGATPSVCSLQGATKSRCSTRLKRS